MRRESILEACADEGLEVQERRCADPPHGTAGRLGLEISGTIHANLRAALQSARRLKSGAVHPDTVEHWARLVAAAKNHGEALDSYSTRELLSDLEQEIEARTRQP